MNIAQGLKKKNSLISEYKKVLDRAVSSNSRVEGARIKYQVREQLDKAAKLRTEIVQLKTHIHEASATMREKIFLFVVRTKGIKDQNGEYDVVVPIILFSPIVLVYRAIWGIIKEYE